MQLSNALVSKFVKASKGQPAPKTGTTVYGTISIIDGEPYIAIDGSQILTPAETTSEVSSGARVTALIKDHTVMITGNISSPSASTERVASAEQNIQVLDTTKIDSEQATDIAKELVTDISVTNYYLAYPYNSGVDYDTPGWTTSIQTMTVSNKYLWNYSEMYGPDATLLNTSEPVIIGAYGDTGSGEKGDGIAASISEDAWNDATWQTYKTPSVERTFPNTSLIRGDCRVNDYFTVSGTATDTGNGYMLTFKSSSATGNLKGYCVSASVAVAGEDGDDGVDGVSIYSITKQYAINQDKTQEPTTWYETRQSWSEGDYLWIRDKIIYQNPDGTFQPPKYTTPYCDSSWEVVENYVPDAEYTEYKNTVDKTFEENDKGYQAQFQTTTESITRTNSSLSTLDEKTAKRSDDLDGVIQKEISTRKELIDLAVDAGGNAYVQISDSNKEESLRLTKGRISFMQNGAEVTYISAGREHIPTLEVEREFVMGNYAFIPRSNGSLDFRKVK